jgi:hypothetical protein
MGNYQQANCRAVLLLDIPTFTQQSRAKYGLEFLRDIKHEAGDVITSFSKLRGLRRDSSDIENLQRRQHLYQRIYIFSNDQAIEKERLSVYIYPYYRKGFTTSGAQAGKQIHLCGTTNLLFWVITPELFNNQSLISMQKSGLRLT